MKRQRWLIAASILVALALSLSLNAAGADAAANPRVLETTSALQSSSTGESPRMDVATVVLTTTVVQPAQSAKRLHLPLLFHWRSEFSSPWPASGATRRSVNTYLTWDLDESRFPASEYAILLAANDPTPDTLLARKLTKRQFDPSTFEPDTEYYWQVIAYDVTGREARSPIWRFRTDYFPAVPELGSMVDVPAGEFKMGCDPANPGYGNCEKNEVPLHPVYLEAFSIDKYEVTNVEYRACVDAGVCKPPRKYGTHLDEPYFDNPEYDYFPVLFVSNWDARDYCGWVDKRLPTEAEWEKAARGAIDTRPWPWGLEHWDCSRMNRCPTTGEWFPTRVDSFIRGQSPYGAVNMAGNTHEWVQDFYLDDYYGWSPYYNPLNIVSQSQPYYSARGGGYHDNWWYARTSHRNAGHHGDDGGSNDAPLFRSFRVGIRCAR